jgi:hypothetical protein
VHETLGYVFDAIKLTKEMLDDEVPLMALLVHLGQLCATRWKDKDLKVLIKQRILFSHPEAAHVLLKNYRYDYFIFTRKVKAGVDAVQVLILGAECCLQLIIKNSLGNTSIRLSKLWQIMLSNCFLERMLVCPK